MPSFIDTFTVIFIGHLYSIHPFNNYRTSITQFPSVFSSSSSPSFTTLQYFLFSHCVTFQIYCTIMLFQCSHFFPFVRFIMTQNCGEVISKKKKKCMIDTRTSIDRCDKRTKKELWMWPKKVNEQEKGRMRETMRERKKESEQWWWCKKGHTKIVCHLYDRNIGLTTTFAHVNGDKMKWRGL